MQRRVLKYLGKCLLWLHYMPNRKNNKRKKSKVERSMIVSYHEESPISRRALSRGDSRPKRKGTLHPSAGADQSNVHHSSSERRSKSFDGGS